MMNEDYSVLYYDCVQQRQSESGSVRCEARKNKGTNWRPQGAWSSIHFVENSSMPRYNEELAP
jgi:hypothetical protein